MEIHSKKMSTAAQLLVGGERTSGESIRSQNGKDNNNRMHPEIIFNFFSVMAALSVANIVKTSLGPVGLDKMLVDDVGVSSFFCFFLLFISFIFIIIGL